MTTMTAVAAWFVAAGSAQAIERVDGAAAPADVKVADDVRSGAGRFSGIGYGTSDRYGRAWLVLHYQYGGECPASDGQCELDAPVQVSVPGLSYDPTTRRVVYQEPGVEPVVCANVRPHRGWLGAGDEVAATGDCSYRLVKVDRLVDDGFGGQRDRREEVHFAIRGR
jgi:hypothetical protein